MGASAADPDRGGIAQMEEQPTLTRQAEGSNPSSASNIGVVTGTVTAAPAKRVYAGSIPAHTSIALVAQWKSAGFLHRARAGSNPAESTGPVAQRMSAEILPRRTQVRFLSGPSISERQPGGARRGLLSRWCLRA
jgi:hypothetical protein